MTIGIIVGVVIVVAIAVVLLLRSRGGSAGDNASSPGAFIPAPQAGADTESAGQAAIQRQTAERVAADKTRAERAAAERAEAERIAAARIAAEQAEAERIAAEQAARIESERRTESERQAAERVAAQQAEAERVQAERLAAAGRAAVSQVPAPREVRTLDPAGPKPLPARYARPVEGEPVASQTGGALPRRSTKPTPPPAKIAPPKPVPQGEARGRIGDWRPRGR